ncbi:ATP-binding protein [Fimbriiglobus ruber]|uniref:histidine kinase n=1 Tax=Fimbriiglobus ruber TaxID=1908690 RepID=A0A225DS56_9BACT|nr:ATP-binding protein [Fimbriiglobus ruber]OWK44290.1 putative SigmaB asociated two-component system sensor protein [Fimbriiglobus ruber]
MTRILALDIADEQGIILARRRTRQVAGLIGFDSQDQVRLATAVSEVARNAFQYAGRGRVEFVLDGRIFRVTVRDHGPGISNLDDVLEGRYTSSNGAGLGLVGARRFVDEFKIESPPTGTGTIVCLGRELPRLVSSPSARDLARITDELAKSTPDDLFAEVRRQNQDLLGALADLREREARLAEMNRELEETNRGVVALFAELEEKADSVRRVSDLKTRFLSNMSHEFRTPLNSIMGLAQLLLDRADGPLTEEQEKQVTFIRRAAGGLSELVNDLLDLAKVEAGKVVIRPEEFRIVDLFATLRGMMRPLLTPDVILSFEDTSGDIVLNTDEGKVSQILRNFLSNALKFTERGEIRVTAAVGPGRTILLAVSDTGIGIAPADQEQIFEEFGQVDSAVQKRVKGTGLGLPLSKRLAELLGGRVSVKSKPGIGSTFFLTIPCVYTGQQPGGGPTPSSLARWLDPARRTGLVVGDDPTSEVLYEKSLTAVGVQAVVARSAAAAREMIRTTAPAVVILDSGSGDGVGWDLLAELKESAATRSIPVVVVSSGDEKLRAQALGAAAFGRKPVDGEWLVRRVRELLLPDTTWQILIIDDDEVARYLLRGMLDGTPFSIVETTGGREGLRAAREIRPRAIFLDLVMPDLSGFEVLDLLKDDPHTRDIPVIVFTSQILSLGETQNLANRTAAIFSKEPNEPREDTSRKIREALDRAISSGGLNE